MVPYIQFTIFALLVTGTCLLIRLNPFRRRHYLSLSDAVIEDKKKHIDERFGRLKWWARGLVRLNATIRMCGSTRTAFWLLVSGCGLAGFGIGLYLFGDIQLSVLTAICMLPAPYIYMSVRARWYRRRQNGLLENTLNLLTNSYISCNDIIKAVSDNLDKLDLPQPFAEFVADVTLIDSNVRRALRKLELKIDHPSFSEWIDIVILSQDKSSDMRYILPTIVASMNDNKKLQIEADTVMASVWREYFLAIGLAFAIIPLLKYANAQWFDILIHHTVGRLLLVLMLVMTVITAFITLKINKPLT